MEQQAKKTFEDIIKTSQKPVLVDFWAPWCEPCKQVAPLIDEVVDTHRGQIEFTKVNVDENPEIASAYRVMGLPTLMMFKNGEPVDAVAGGISRGTLASLIGNVVGM